MDRSREIQNKGWRTRLRGFFSILDYVLYRVTMLVLAGIGAYKLIVHH